MFPTLTTEERLKRLAPPQGTIRMVLDTDTFNEIDDQFALVYAMQSPERLNLEAIYAAPFDNHLSTGPEDGMEKSYEEIQRLLGRIDGLTSLKPRTFKGSRNFLQAAEQPVESDAASDLVKRARSATPDDPLYVVAIGAITNVASAILIDPSIITKIVVVWLGGHDLHWRNTMEFNLFQDIHASRLILDCGVPLVLIPCHGVASHLITTLPEIEEYVQGQGAIGDYLAETCRNCSGDHFAYSRVIWDISTIAYLNNPEWVPTDLVHSPVLTDQFTWSVDRSRHFIRSANFVHRDSVFRDLFQKLRRYGTETK